MSANDWGDEELWIVTAKETSTQETQSGQKSVNHSSNPYNSPSATVSGEEVQVSRVKAETLAAQMSQFMRVISRVFAKAQQEVERDAGLQLDEIKLAVEISGKGEVKLLGSGIETSGKGALELKFKRVESPKNPKPSESA